MFYEGYDGYNKLLLLCSMSSCVWVWVNDCETLEAGYRCAPSWHENNAAITQRLCSIAISTHRDILDHDDNTNKRPTPGCGEVRVESTEIHYQLTGRSRINIISGCVTHCPFRRSSTYWWNEEMGLLRGPNNIRAPIKPPRTKNYEQAKRSIE
jgi:hypothetical protein